MINYKGNIVEGQETSWQRAFEVNIDNTYGQQPSLSFKEEVITVIPSGKKMIEPARSSIIKIPFVNNELIQLINPEDDNPLDESQEIIAQSIAGLKNGLVSHQFLQLILYSLYKQEAIKRDVQ